MQVHDRAWPDLADRVREPFEPVADEHQLVGHAPVLDLREHPQPILGALALALAVLASPQPEDVAGALGGHRQREIDRPVGHVALADLDVDAVDEHHRIHRVQGPVLPLGHAVHHPIGDRRDGLCGDLRTVDLGQMRGDLPGGQPLGRQRDHQVIHPESRRCRLATILGSKLPSRSRGTVISTGPASVSTVLARLPLREFPPVRPAGSCLR
jgi:hypothetical protein